MNITNVIIRKLFTGGSVLATFSVVIDNCFTIHDIRLIEGEERCFAALPSRRDENGVYRDIIHPIGSEFRVKLETAILEAYMQRLTEMGKGVSV